MRGKVKHLTHMFVFFKYNLFILRVIQQVFYLNCHIPYYKTFLVLFPISGMLLSLLLLLVYCLHITVIVF